MIRLTDILNELTFHDITKKKNKWIVLKDKNDRKAIAKNLWVLVGNAYAPLGGHVSVKKLGDIYDGKLVYWEAIDIDGDPDADAVLFGRKVPSGIKISGIGHDNSSGGKSAIINHQITILKKSGYWVEASLKMQDIMYGKGAPYVKEQAKVEKLFGQKVEWQNDKGKYKRKLESGKYTDIETVFGKPKI